MLRRTSKSIYSDRTETPVLQFQHFKRKYQEILTDVDQTSFSITASSNSIFIGIVLANIIKGYISVQSVKNSFKNLDFLHIDKQHAKYLNEKTLLSLMKNIITNITDADSAAKILNYYPVVQFVLNIYSRTLISDFLNQIYKSKNDDFLEELMGNQQEVIVNYEMEMRGVLLNLLGHRLQNNIEIIHNQSNLVEVTGPTKKKLNIKIEFESFTKSHISFQQVNQMIKNPILANTNKQLLNINFNAPRPFQIKTDRYKLTKENAIYDDKQAKNEKSVICQPQKISNKTIDYPHSTKRISRGQKPCNCQKLLCRKCK